MRRYLLDTNILVFLILGKNEEVSRNVLEVLEDFNNEICTSSICVAELLQLFRIGKIKLSSYRTLNEIQSTIGEKFYIKVLPFSNEHTETFSKLEIYKGHNDPFDHMIISHAITEKLCLISSDKMFSNYSNQKLDFICNKR